MSTTPKPKTVRAEARECSCGHVGINDSHATLAACNHCEWSGPSPKEDHCPECERDGTMCLACPECGGLYRLIAECDISVDRAALTQGAGAFEPVATVEALQARIAALEAELDDMEAERDEALRGPWPEWAEQMKKTIRKHSGYDGFDDASEGIDLAAELDELMEHAVEPSAQQLQQAVACAVEECAQLCDKTYHQFIGPEFGEVRHGIAACAAAIRAKGTQ